MYSVWISNFIRCSINTHRVAAPSTLHLNAQARGLHTSPPDPPPPHTPSVPAASCLPAPRLLPTRSPVLYPRFRSVNGCISLHSIVKRCFPNTCDPMDDHFVIRWLQRICIVFFKSVSAFTSYLQTHECISVNIFPPDFFCEKKHRNHYRIHIEHFTSFSDIHIP